ncbi:hypothetical protein L0Y40_01900 [Candidatus Wolfebacteria bacterium]|nr:hypothetical protein [Candidatus Wolfebacteria bacterium]
MPKYTIEDIKFGTDKGIFDRAVRLYEGGKVTRFCELVDGHSAVVLGTSSYEVFVSARGFDRGYCTCYLGEQDTLCKHMVAVAMRAAVGGKPLSAKDKKRADEVVSSGRKGELNKTELSAAKKKITAALRYIKSYDGPSRTWFAYQDSLLEGRRRLSAVFSDLPVSRQTAKFVVDTLVRIDEKLSRGGVDDSDGTVGNLIVASVDMLKEYAKIEPKCAEAFRILEGRSTMFDWEEPLLKLID